jgi:adenylate cyclase
MPIRRFSQFRLFRLFAEQALKFDPNYAFAHDILALVLAFSGRAEEALSPMEKALRLNPKPPAHLFLHQGVVYYTKGMFEDALSALKKGLSLSPNAIDIRLRLAACYSALGQEDEARAEVAAVLNLNPRMSVGYLSKVLPYKNQADREKILNDLAKAGLK